MSNGTKDCTGPYVGLSLTSVALLMSVCINILLYSLRRKDRQNRDVGVPLYQDSFNSGRFEEEERQTQDNPIYGNIFVDGGGGPLTMTEYGDNEQMTKKGARHDEKSDPEDVSYASLDLRLVQKKKKKKRYQEKQNQMHKVQTHPPPGAQMGHRRMEMGADCDVALPSRSSSLIVSRSSIYLNSHQVALETEELHREREGERETEWRSNHE